MQENAKVYGNTASGVGGGVYASYGTLTMRDNAEVSGNRVTGDYASGGGIGTGYYTTIAMQDHAKVSGNTASGDYATGGGMYAFYHAGFTMRDNAEISGNTATGDHASGGGLAVVGQILTMTGNTAIKNNTAAGAESYGGGVLLKLAIYVYGDHNGELWMRDSASVSGNEAQNGGGIYVDTGASTEYYDGGSLYPSSRLISNILCMYDNASVHGNRASGNGGGVLVNGTGNADYSGRFRISGGVIPGNTGPAEQQNTAAQGAALYVVPAATAQRGTWSGDTFTGLGNLSTTGNAIRVVNGALQ
jgi:predicted outer membrane repeat protein